MVFANRILVVFLAAVVAPLSQAAMLVAKPITFNTDSYSEINKEEFGFNSIDLAQAAAEGFFEQRIPITSPDQDNSIAQPQFTVSLNQDTYWQDLTNATIEDSIRLSDRIQAFAKSSSESFSDDDDGFDDDDDDDEFDDHDDDDVVPTPGVLALFPAAGIIALRRRRR